MAALGAARSPLSPCAAYARHITTAASRAARAGQSTTGRVVHHAPRRLRCASCARLVIRVMLSGSWGRCAGRALSAREHRGEAVVLVVTAGAVLVTNMFEGVLIGLLLAVVKTAWETPCSARAHPRLA